MGPLFKMGNHVVLKLVCSVGMIPWNMSKDGNRYEKKIFTVFGFHSLIKQKCGPGFYQVNAPLQVFRKTVGGRNEESVGVHKRI